MSAGMRAAPNRSRTPKQRTSVDSQARSGRWRVVWRASAYGRTDAVVVQSSQFGSGFDCAMTHKGGCRNAKCRGDGLSEDLGCIVHGSPGCGSPLPVWCVIPGLA
eukprot:5842766-Amphidinium_carterae.2